MSREYEPVIGENVKRKGSIDSFVARWRENMKPELYALLKKNTAQRRADIRNPKQDYDFNSILLDLSDMFFGENTTGKEQIIQKHMLLTHLLTALPQRFGIYNLESLLDVDSLINESENEQSPPSLGLLEVYMRYIMQTLPLQDAEEKICKADSFLRESGVPFLANHVLIDRYQYQLLANPNIAEQQLYSIKNGQRSIAEKFQDEGGLNIVHYFRLILLGYHCELIENYRAGEKPYQGFNDLETVVKNGFDYIKQRIQSKSASGDCDIGASYQTIKQLIEQKGEDIIRQLLTKESELYAHYLYAFVANILDQDAVSVNTNVYWPKSLRGESKESSLVNYKKHIEVTLEQSAQDAGAQIFLIDWLLLKLHCESDKLRRDIVLEQLSEQIVHAHPSHLIQKNLHLLPRGKSFFAAALPKQMEDNVLRDPSVLEDMVRFYLSLGASADTRQDEIAKALLRSKDLPDASSELYEVIGKLAMSFVISHLSRFYETSGLEEASSDKQSAIAVLKQVLGDEFILIHENQRGDLSCGSGGDMNMMPLQAVEEKILANMNYYAQFMPRKQGGLLSYHPHLSNHQITDHQTGFGFADKLVVVYHMLDYIVTDQAEDKKDSVAKLKTIVSLLSEGDQDKLQPGKNIYWTELLSFIEQLEEDNIDRKFVKNQIQGIYIQQFGASIPPKIGSIEHLLLVHDPSQQESLNDAKRRIRTHGLSLAMEEDPQVYQGTALDFAYSGSGSRIIVAPSPNRLVGNEHLMQLTNPLADMLSILEREKQKSDTNLVGTCIDGSPEVVKVGLQNDSIFQYFRNLEASSNIIDQYGCDHRFFRLLGAKRRLHTLKDYALSLGSYVDRSGFLSYCESHREVYEQLGINYGELSKINRCYKWIYQFESNLSQSNYNLKENATDALRRLGLESDSEALSMIHSAILSRFEFQEGLGALSYMNEIKSQNPKSAPISIQSRKQDLLNGLLLVSYLAPLNITKDNLILLIKLFSKKKLPILNPRVAVALSDYLLGSEWNSIGIPKSDRGEVVASSHEKYIIDGLSNLMQQQEKFYTASIQWASTLLKEGREHTQLRKNSLGRYRSYLRDLAIIPSYNLIELNRHGPTPIDEHLEGYSDIRGATISMLAILLHTSKKETYNQRIDSLCLGYTPRLEQMLALRNSDLSPSTSIYQREIFNNMNTNEGKEQYAKKLLERTYNSIISIISHKHTIMQLIFSLGEEPKHLYGKIDDIREDGSLKHGGKLRILQVQDRIVLIRPSFLYKALTKFYEHMKKVTREDQHGKALGLELDITIDPSYMIEHFHYSLDLLMKYHEQGSRNAAQNFLDSGLQQEDLIEKKFFEQLLCFFDRIGGGNEL